MTHFQNVKRRWTQTDISQLRREAADGSSIDMLSTSLGRARDDVHRMATRLNMPIFVAPIRQPRSAEKHDSGSLVDPLDGVAS